MFLSNTHDLSGAVKSQQQKRIEKNCCTCSCMRLNQTGCILGRPTDPAMWTSQQCYVGIGCSTTSDGSRRDKRISHTVRRPSCIAESSIDRPAQRSETPLTLAWRPGAEHGRPCRTLPRIPWTQTASAETWSPPEHPPVQNQSKEPGTLKYDAMRCRANVGSSATTRVHRALRGRRWNHSLRW